MFIMNLSLYLEILPSIKLKTRPKTTLVILSWFHIIQSMYTITKSWYINWQREGGSFICDITIISNKSKLNEHLIQKIFITKKKWWTKNRLFDNYEEICKSSAWSFMTNFSSGPNIIKLFCRIFVIS